MAAVVAWRVFRAEVMRPQVFVFIRVCLGTGYFDCKRASKALIVEIP